MVAPAVVDERDIRFLERYALPFLDGFSRWFRPEVRGLDRLPAHGPFLVVGSHSGGLFLPDSAAFLVAWARERGIDDPLHVLVYDLTSRLPGIGRALHKIGCVAASPTAAEAALAQGQPVLVYPGGDHEACRPWRERHRVDLGGHTGFVRLALRAGVPVIPVVNHGSHESDLILFRGERVAKALGLRRLRVSVMPIVASVPFGLVPIFVPHLPLPARVTVEVLEPLDWSHHRPGGADEPAIVAACYEEITGVLQAALDRLAEVPALPLLDPPPRHHP